MCAHLLTPRLPSRDEQLFLALGAGAAVCVHAKLACKFSVIADKAGISFELYHETSFYECMPQRHGATTTVA